MNDTCEPTDSIPRTCSDAFGAIRQDLAALKSTSDAIHQQMMKTNGHVEDLFNITNAHGNRIMALEIMENARGKRTSTWVRRLWRLGAAIILLLAGYLLKASY